MRIQRIVLGTMLLCACLQAQMTDEQKFAVTGKLTRVMAIGGESTGWSIAIETLATLDGHVIETKMQSVEVAYKKPAKLESLENKRVTAIGKMVHRQGVETGDRMVLEATSIKEAKPQ